MKILIAVSIALVMLSCRKAETPAPPSTTSTAKPQPPQPGETTAATEVGDTMPAYSAKTLDGAAYDLAVEKGNVVLVNVWATWCGPCRFEIPELQKLHDQNGARGFKVVGVSVDEGDPAEVKQFVADQKMTYPVVVDAEGRIASLLQTTVLPTSVLIDRNGKIVWRKIGAIEATDPKLAAALTAALGGAKS
jgi:cytochrome c biogenesis protein CcmG, thiol:disulfide interchange protein DsbE